MDYWLVLVGWILFAGTHIGLSAEPVRGTLVGKMGEKGFLGVYSLVALITFAFLITAFVQVDSSPAFWGAEAPASWLVHVSELLMLMAFILFFCGFTNPSPMAMGAADTKSEAYGILRITRHPMNMAFALFGLAHALVIHTAADWIFYLGFVLYGVLGAAHQDKKKIRQKGSAFQTFVDSTSILPFVAIGQGRQAFKPAEISKIGILLAIAATVIARLLHPAIRSQLF